jgi:hypothetical protein
MRRAFTLAPPVDGRASRIARSASRRVRLRSRLSGMSSTCNARCLSSNRPIAGTNSRFATIGTEVKRTDPVQRSCFVPRVSPIRSTWCSIISARCATASPLGVRFSVPSDCRETNVVPEAACKAARYSRVVNGQQPSGSGDRRSAPDGEQVAQVVPVFDLHCCSLASQIFAFNPHSRRCIACRSSHARR